MLVIEFFARHIFFREKPFSDLEFIGKINFGKSFCGEKIVSGSVPKKTTFSQQYLCFASVPHVTRPRFPHGDRLRGTNNNNNYYCRCRRKCRQSSRYTTDGRQYSYSVILFYLSSSSRASFAATETRPRPPRASSRPRPPPPPQYVIGRVDVTSAEPAAAAAVVVRHRAAAGRPARRGDMNETPPGCRRPTAGNRSRRHWSSGGRVENPRATTPRRWWGTAAGAALTRPAGSCRAARSTAAETRLNVRPESGGHLS